MRLVLFFECMFWDLYKKLSYLLNLNIINLIDNVDNKEFNRCFIGGFMMGYWWVSVSVKFIYKCLCGC